MEGQEACGPDGGNGTGLFGAVFSTVKSAFNATWNAVTKDGILPAMTRQGADELGTALKAFPDSIQTDEPGTLWNPTQGEIAAARNPDLPSPSEVARGNKEGNAGQPQQAPGLVLISPTPTPSEVAKGGSSSLYGPELEQGPALPSPSEIAREKGDVLMQEKKGWEDREIERRQKASQDGNAENDQNERAKGRSLPDEQKQQEQERTRGR